MLFMFIFALAYKLRLIVFLYYSYKRFTIKGSPSQWPRGIDRGSAAAQLAGIAVSNSAGGMCVCCVLSGRRFFRGLITRPEESYRV